MIRPEVRKVAEAIKNLQTVEVQKCSTYHEFKEAYNEVDEKLYELTYVAEISAVLKRYFKRQMWSARHSAKILFLQLNEERNRKYRAF